MASDLTLACRALRRRTRYSTFTAIVLGLDASAFGIAPDLDVTVLRDRIEDVLGRP